MAKKLKVYSKIIMAYRDMECARPQRQVCAIVAAPSQKEAARLMCISLSDFRHNGSETGNAEQIATAMSEPGQVFYSPDNFRHDYRRWEGQAAKIAERERQYLDQIERDERWAREREEKIAARRAADERAHQNSMAADAWVERLTAEFGLECHNPQTGRLEVATDPEALYGHLVRISGELRDMGLDPLWLGGEPTTE